MESIRAVQEFQKAELQQQYTFTGSVNHSQCYSRIKYKQTSASVFDIVLRPLQCLKAFQILTRFLPPAWS